MAYVQNVNLAKLVIQEYMDGLEGVSKTLCEQIMYGSTMDNAVGLHAMMSWGTEIKEGYGMTEDSHGGLKFTVDGRLFTGEVKVDLAFNDTYTITLTNADGTVLEVIEDVFFDQLTELLDNKIERRAS